MGLMLAIGGLGHGHVLAAKVYWTDITRHTIQRANVDGTGTEDLVTTGLDTATGIALDAVLGKMYWTDGVTDKIQRANLDGSDVEDLVTTGLGQAFAIVLDVTANKMYWTDIGSNTTPSPKSRIFAVPSTEPCPCSCGPSM